MADRSAIPTFVEDDAPVRARSAGSAAERRVFVASFDPYLLVVVGALLAIGAMMVYSATFDWSFQSFGSETYIFGLHLRNMAIGGAIMLVLLRRLPSLAALCGMDLADYHRAAGSGAAVR